MRRYVQRLEGVFNDMPQPMRALLTQGDKKQHDSLREKGMGALCARDADLYARAYAITHVLSCLDVFRRGSQEFLWPN